MAGGVSLYEQVVAVAGDYLGPTADRFMRRQISTHLGKEPEDLRTADLDALIDWVKLTFALLTDDTGLIDAFAARLYALAHTANRPAARKP